LYAAVDSYGANGWVVRLDTRLRGDHPEIVARPTMWFRCGELTPTEIASVRATHANRALDAAIAAGLPNGRIPAAPAGRPLSTR
jgi:hypothetical protein